MKLYIFGAACVLAVLVAASAHEDRRVLVLCAVAILANWIACSMPWIYAPASVEFLTARTGTRLTQEEGWAMFDLAALTVTAMVGRRVWWGMVIPSMYLAMLVMLGFAAAEGLNYDEYSLINDTALVIALSVIFAQGGRGARDWLRGRWRVRLAPRLSFLAAHLARGTR